MSTNSTNRNNNKPETAFCTITAVDHHNLANTIKNIPSKKRNFLVPIALRCNYLF